MMRERFVILVVEDEELHRKMLAKVLDVLGYTVMVATSGEGAVELVGRQRPDLILMDINLPGMDGLAATRMIKGNALTAAIPIIALTALAMVGDQEKMLAAGCDDYLAKPALIKPLGAKLGEWLGGGRNKTGQLQAQEGEGASR